MQENQEILILIYLSPNNYQALLIFPVTCLYMCSLFLITVIISLKIIHDIFFLDHSNTKVPLLKHILLKAAKLLYIKPNPNIFCLCFKLSKASHYLEDKVKAFWQTIQGLPNLTSSDISSLILPHFPSHSRPLHVFFAYPAPSAQLRPCLQTSIFGKAPTCLLSSKRSYFLLEAFSEPSPTSFPTRN